MVDFDRDTFVNFAVPFSQCSWFNQSVEVAYRSGIKQFESRSFRSTSLAFALHDVLIDFISTKRIIRLEPDNSNSVILNSPLFRTLNYFP